MPQGTNAFFIPECDSTNTLAVEAGNKGKVVPSWFIAGKQNAGRGRRGRPWTSETGNLFCSYLFQPSAQLSNITPLPFIVALALRDTLIALGCHPEQVKCKWPNDVLVNEQKISGILIESSTAHAGNTGFIVIGIGVNLAHTPSGTQFIATSLTDILDKTLSPQTVFKKLAKNLAERLQSWTQDQMSLLVEEWSACAWGLGNRREIRTNDATFHARVMGLAPDGALKLKLDDGSSKQIYAGDVFK
ncbi:biotin--[acetyl-CoA-carboxylase] ligase [Kordiimonas aquimaris]|uniref:biotin--[acetyl-CoA-carboxylase] ligase n=1 Tax=Kordiimonas aquimaris TaxID=707591 RepID=UPI0021CE0879|nr:biotin--[acetyl-CoA-carboxylase] ligase [Kordiimonas aquimaris]